MMWKPLSLPMASEQILCSNYRNHPLLLFGRSHRRSLHLLRLLAASLIRSANTLNLQVLGKLRLLR
jgi:hypothetical protein